MAKRSNERDSARKIFDTLLNCFAKSKQEGQKRGLKGLIVISGKTFDMIREGTKVMSIKSVAGHQVVKNLSEPSEITLIHLNIYADYLRGREPNLDSRAVRALLTTGGPRLMRVEGHYIEIYGPYPILMNVDGIYVYTKAHVTNATDQVCRIYISRQELKVRRSVKRLLDTGAVVSVMPISTWTDMGFDRSDLIPTNIRLAAANQGASTWLGRLPSIRCS